MKTCLLLIALLAFANADLYLHNPRGSNNRLNEANAERNNGNRLFDSQNNNRGGYNVGDKTATAATDNTNTDAPATTFDPTSTTTQQYQMVYYEGSILQIEWTSQHGCGGNEINDPYILNCNMVLQYACDRTETTDASLTVALRDGTTTNQVNEDGTDNTRGYHENAQWYKECKNRQRNKGLFTADQTLAGDQAIYTRQNPNNNRRGLECPEERDYYPYWLPTIWRDIAYLTDRLDLCPWIQAESQNVKGKYKCYDSNASGTILSQTNAEDCSAKGGQWLQFQHKNAAAPECLPATYGRTNHLGNTRNGQMANYNWTLPTFDSLVAAGVKIYDNDYAKCVFRIRYNISTDDYDPWNTNATYNGDRSPVRDNPTVDIGSDLNALKLALNTDQTGRTFQDRSHIFYIRRRPAALAGARIINLNVRGKRGNIVQTFPAIEYDFVPNRFHVSASAKDYIHIQWTGSNTHNNNPNAENAGDGQGGDAGEGTGGTDRQNFVQLANLGENYPIPLDKFAQNMFSATNCWTLTGTQIGIDVTAAANAGKTNVDCAVWLATSGYYRAASAVRGATGGNDDLNPTLNNANPSLVGGVVMKITRPGSYFYACTRNNNFSNRSQKGTIVVDA